MENNILVIGIAGGTGSGKTTLMKNIMERFGDVITVLSQYQQTVKPMHEKYVEPSKKYANLVVPEGGKNFVALDMIIDRIQRHLNETAERS